MGVAQMKHLTVDEIINFVSLTELNDEALVLCAYVNEHIRKCKRCREIVRAFQMIYDEFTKNAACRDFKKYILENYLNHKFENENFLDFELSDDDIDLLR